MARKRNILNVRAHLEHIQSVLDDIEKYGHTASSDAELAKARIINRAILWHHAAKNTRKDIRVPAGSGT